MEMSNIWEERTTRSSIRGLRIELGEIESRSGISRCERNVSFSQKVFGKIDSHIAYVVGGPELEIHKISKRHTDARSLPEYMIPNHFQMIGEVPLTPTERRIESFAGNSPPFGKLVDCQQ